jgi:hypothetical protein
MFCARFSQDFVLTGDRGYLVHRRFSDAVEPAPAHDWRNVEDSVEISGVYTPIRQRCVPTSDGVLSSARNSI